MKRSECFGLLASAFLLATPAMADECADYAKHLKTCEPFVCAFKHPFTHKMMQKKIIGMTAGKCKTTEEMPNKGKLECNLTPKTQAAVAAEIATLAAAKQVDADGKTDSEGKINTTLQADGKPVHNALEDARDSGECVVSGYSH